MANSDYICKKCKKVVKAKLLGRHFKYECPKCGTLCKDCVSKKLFSTKCKHCGSTVITREYDGKRWKTA